MFYLIKYLYTFDGKLDISPSCRIGYVSQFSEVDKTKEITVFEFIAERFIEIQKEIDLICEEMSTSDDIELLMEKYQEALDDFNAIDGDNYESNIKKK